MVSVVLVSILSLGPVVQHNKKSLFACKEKTTLITTREEIYSRLIVNTIVKKCTKVKHSYKNHLKMVSRLLVAKHIWLLAELQQWTFEQGNQHIIIFPTVLVLGLDRFWTQIGDIWCSLLILHGYKYISLEPSFYFSLRDIFYTSRSYWTSFKISSQVASVIHLHKGSTQKKFKMYQDKLQVDII